MITEIDTLTHSSELPQVHEEVRLLSCVDGPDRGQEYLLGRASLTLGSSRAAGVRINDRSVSRLHCRVSRSPDGIELEDLGSKNGIWVGDIRLQRGFIPLGARFRIGETLLELRLERRTFRRPVYRGGDRFGELMGSSENMQELFGLMTQLAASEVPVLLSGESGTGKELAARSIHANSQRSSGPFVVIDCPSLSEALADSELFGHAAGAFSGATHDRAGAFEQADGGTLFLDEVADLPLSLQPKLLRALADRSVRRMGETEHRSIDVRIIASTRRSLATMVNEGAFRDDLYYRIAILEAQIPPLRQRVSDIHPMADHFMDEAEVASDDPVRQRVHEAIRAREGAFWYGNVRELKGLIFRVLTLGESGGSLPPAQPLTSGSTVSTAIPFGRAKANWVARFEEAYLSQLIHETGGNIREAARRAKLARSRLYVLLERYQLRR